MAEGVFWVSVGPVSCSYCQDVVGALVAWVHDSDEIWSVNTSANVEAGSQGCSSRVLRPWGAKECCHVMI